MQDTHSVPNLIQGVSQQSAQQRRDSQCEAQFDCLNSPVVGCAARPHAELVAILSGHSTLVGAKFGEIFRDGENYVIGTNATNPFAYDLADGTVCTITMTEPAGYIAGTGTANDRIRLQTVQDTTFIVNRQTAVAMAGTLSASRDPEALAFVRSGAFDTHFALSLSGPGTASGSYVTSATVVDSANPRSIVTDWKADIDAAPGGYTADLYNAVLHIYRADNADFTAFVADGNGHDFAYIIKNFTTSFEKLPAHAPNGYLVEVRGESRTEQDNYWLEFETLPNPGAWHEVIAPATKTSLSATTMPHILTNTGYRAFTYNRASWSTRICGDEDTAPDPGFVGTKIRDAFYHQGRLALLYPDGCTWSKTRFPYTYFPDTVQTKLATAPIDTDLVPGKSSQGSSQMDFAVQVSDDLYVWSQRCQFRIHSGQEVFKQETIEAPPASAYEYTDGSDPLAVGNSLFFATDVGPFSSMRALQFNQGKVQGDTQITAHVPRYIASGARWMAASDALGLLFVGSDDDDKAIYVYTYLIENGEYVVSSWNKWRFPGGQILWGSVNANKLRLLQQRVGQVAYLTVDLTPYVVDTDVGAGYLTRLDFRVNETKVTGLAYNAVANTSSFTLPYTPTVSAGQSLTEEVQVVTRKDKVGGFTRGRRFVVTSVVGAVVTVTGNLTGYEFYVGQRITTERTESRFYLRGENGVIPVDRLTVNYFRLYGDRTGYTRVEVITANKETRKYPYEGRTLGTSTAVTETPVLGEFDIKASVGEQAKECTIRVVNDTFLPSHWQTAAWDYTAVGGKGSK